MCEPELVVLLVYALEQRHFLAARSAPARPEIDHHHLALVLRQADAAAALGAEGEGRRRTVRVRQRRGSGEKSSTAVKAAKEFLTVRPSRKRRSYQ